MKVLLIAPYFDADATGEAWSTFKWIEGINERHEVTVLTVHPKGWDQSKSSLPNIRIINWDSLEFPESMVRLNRELKPSYVRFYFQARRWIKQALARGETFELGHQINPLALRYPSPLSGLGIKYLIGPLAGSLPTPTGFKSEAKEASFLRRLRSIDSVRLKWDPCLKKSYKEAAAVIGVAPYVETYLSRSGYQKFFVESETGVVAVAGKPKPATDRNTPLRLLFVGRIIRTKGVIDAVRAVAQASKQADIRFDVIGDGDMKQACIELTNELGMESIVTFHGQIPRKEVDAWYEKSDIFLFPSFREPSGNVVFESLGKGLPVITTTAGGPGYVINDSCGITITPDTPKQFASDLADAIILLNNDRLKLAELSSGAIERMTNIALWERKSQNLEKIYQQLS